MKVMYSSNYSSQAILLRFSNIFSHPVDCRVLSFSTCVCSNWSKCYIWCKVSLLLINDQIDRVICTLLSFVNFVGCASLATRTSFDALRNYSSPYIQGNWVNGLCNKLCYFNNKLFYFSITGPVFKTIWHNLWENILLRNQKFWKCRSRLKFTYVAYWQIPFVLPAAGHSFNAERKEGVVTTLHILLIPNSG